MILESKENPYYIVAENLAELCPVVIHRVGLVNDQLGYLIEEISRQGVEGTALFLMLTIKYERNEMEGRAVKPKGTGTW